ncbi:lipase secretion chaperone [Noviherbaspirillum saxi]|uniref:Lipase helper protein n=1 Tax=Noviherbaspirillum saxi TaxID=2320863 RepID=A0A3A3G1B3_9BURK|nr:lipase secretion chaperone [Noviherbaspirillum saxi]RJF91863.1 hypothetical protein D3871_24610 [Noviherbaspirillum saxi]
MQERSPTCSPSCVQWKARIATYLAERSKLLNAGGTEADRQAVIQQLRQLRFSPQEQLRVPVYE